jgi:RND family efflux transporter MFP subunit
MVYYQQPIFKLPDLSQMKVKAKVHESQVKKVKQGQPAEILVSSLPNQVLHGKILKIATLADSRGPWDDRGVKEYITEISIDDLPASAGLKPGMTAEVRIQAGTYKDVLMIPVSAVSERDGKHYVYAQNNGFEKRQVTVGESNEKFIEIKDGVKEGDKVALNTRKRLTDEAKASEAIAAPPKQPAATTPAAPVTAQAAAAKTPPSN